MNTIWKMQSSAFLGFGMFVTVFSASSGQAPISAAEAPRLAIFCS